MSLRSVRLLTVIVFLSVCPLTTRAELSGGGEGFTAEVGLGAGAIAVGGGGAVVHDAIGFGLRLGLGAFVNPRTAVGVLLEGFGSSDAGRGVESTAGTGWFGLRAQWFPHDRWSFGAGLGSMAATVGRDGRRDLELQGLGVSLEGSWIFERTEDVAHHIRVALTLGLLGEDDDELGDFDATRTLFVGYTWQKR